jgi:hypothetical protein
LADDNESASMSRPLLMNVEELRRISKSASPQPRSIIDEDEKSFGILMLVSVVVAIMVD